MSTILKALRRLEEQKQGGAERPLRDEVVLAPGRSGGRSSLVRALVAGVVLLAAGVALVLGLRSEIATEPPVAAEAELPAIAAEPPATTFTVSAPDAVVETAVVPVPDVPRDFEIVRPDPTASPRPLAPLPLPTIGEEEVLAPDPVARSAPSRPAPFEYLEEPLEASPEPRAARAVEPLRVARTLWHPSPERRLAWVEVDGQTALREVREGERVGRFLVREIEPAAVLFADGDAELRREVGP